MGSALPASAFNVFRWTALGTGVAYGVWHRSTLSKQAEHKRKLDEYHFKEELIKEAKAEYQKQKHGHDAPTEINWEDAKSVESALERFAKDN